MELFVERGYDQTTVAEIARRAGLTERTFFRHFTDKREVLFAGSHELRAVLVTAVADAPPSASPIEAVTAGLGAVGEMFRDRWAGSRQRQGLIATHAELQERELIKLAALSAAVAEALRERGVAEPAASLAAEAGIGVFRIAFDRWVAGPQERGLSELLRESLDALRALVVPA